MGSRVLRLPDFYRAASIREAKRLLPCFLAVRDTFDAPHNPEGSLNPGVVNSPYTRRLEGGLHPL